jgi:imidazolonepropionase-like amidohydrolase
MQAIQAATSMGPKTLGLKAPNSGSLEPGKISDILCIKENPLDKLEILQKRENILMVLKSGKLVVKNGKIIND